MTITRCMISEIWNLTDRIFCHFEPFLPFYPPNNLENQNFENLKKPFGDIIILHKCTENHDHMLYCSLDIARKRCNCYFSFLAIFCPFTSLTAQKVKIKKNEKNAGIYHHFTIVYQKSWSYAILFLRYGAWRM